MAKLPKTKQGAVAAAKKALGPEAIEGIDFNVQNTGAGWTHVEGSGTLARTAAKTKAAPKPKAAPKAKPAAAAKPKAAPKPKAPAKPKAAENAVVKPPAAPKAPRAKKAERGLPTAAKGPSKGDIILALIKRPQGADVDELGKAAGWQKHSVRGFIAGNLKKNGTDVVTSKEGEGANRRTVYRINEAEPI